MMPGLSKGLIAAGVLLVLLGVLVSLAGKLPWLGRLPGDILIKRENFSLYMPLATCLLLSLFVSLLLWLFRR